MSQDDPTHRPGQPDPQVPRYDAPAGGWGSLKGIASVARHTQVSSDALKALWRQNKPGGVMCTGCAWAKPANHETVEFCENGAKATIWELTRARCTPEVLAAHSLEELRSWPDHDLEQLGRLTHPMRYDPESDTYVAVSWEEAFAGIGAELKSIDPADSVFYSSGHAGLEAAFLYQLFARAYGHNNLPQSSNMCHETTSVGLKQLIGSPVGTCVLPDFEDCDAILFFGQNTGTNSPRFMRTLKNAVDRGCRIVTFNPVRERGLVEFVDPQHLSAMATGSGTRISEHYFQVRPGGDVAVLAGMIKLVLEAEAEAPGTVLDQDFIDAETAGFEEMAATVSAMSWEDIEEASGLDREMITTAAEVYLGAKKVIAIYGMGLTQHVGGFDNLGMLVNLLLLRGNIGRSGAGISPVRGHSNVQGQRTVGVAEKPGLVPLDKLEELFGITCPREEGMNAVHASQAILEGRAKAMILLGGNLVRALPDSARMEGAWGALDLTVYIATKLNRSHLTPGRASYILPCLGRLDEDMQATGRQAVTIEDSLSHIHGSVGAATPASEHLLSEVAIVGGLAKAVLEPNPKLAWDDWTGDYGLVRDLIEAVYPGDFRDFNARMFEPGGFYRGNPARERDWQTEGGRAWFTAPSGISALGARPGEGQMTLVTLRSNDQFNTTIYGYEDRLRGLSGARDVVLINPDEMARRGLSEGQRVDLACAVEDGVERVVRGLAVTPFDLPAGCVAGYYPELNPLVPVDYCETRSGTPAYKGTPVVLRR
ncbi:FdhF/YdeP family oxidoreductase [Histidinibacterium aquaticum]|uniref:FdhF/YdeP family oxidoreductase n=1 Tax=Histidinibacterium aquaticum TaxID=2613962 RepID=A0A5J5GCE6_9RHOB|nr:FdhF/YdeP family oxidoreductase [Histidinibacterium aquaticum]KAA9005628.1 FdhF/YdeP family oxidoreductase [Histidinibacterium aquaticum]